MVVFSKAPEELREKVLVQWFQGISRDEIAKNIGIGAGTVSEINKMYIQNDSDFDLERIRCERQETRAHN
jgi:hypothetical protein